MFRTLLLATIFVGLMAGTSLAAGITGSDHDLSVVDATDESGQICLPCHTPHADAGTTLLWNRAAGAALTLRVGSVPGVATTGCMSCHDGVTAVGAAPFKVVAAMIEGTDDGFVGVDLTTDHPVGVAYPATADYDAAHTTPLFDDKVECGSCHNPHEQGADEDADFLRITTVNSALCLDCHDI